MHTVVKLSCDYPRRKASFKQTEARDVPCLALIAATEPVIHCGRYFSTF